MAPLTDEHALPRWLGTLGPNQVGTVRHQYVGQVAAEDLSREYSALGLDITVKVACAMCNNGWMLALETQVKPLIEQMSRGNSMVLTGPSCQLLVGWLPRRS